jgi:hypothetical protein
MQGPSYTAFSNIVLESDILAGKSRAGKKFSLPAGKERRWPFLEMSVELWY